MAFNTEAQRHRETGGSCVPHDRAATSVGGDHRAPRVRLGELLEPYKELDQGRGFEVVAVGRYGIRRRDEIYSKALSKDTSKNRVIRRNTLTLGMGSKQIDIGILTEDVVYSVSPAYHTYRIHGVDGDYLRYELDALNSDMSRRFMIASCRQGKSVDLNRWYDYELPVYDSVAQREIAAELDRICAMKKNAEERVDICQQLVKSKFVEMFGEGQSKTLSWDELFTTKTGKLDSNAAEDQGEYPFFTCAKEPLWINTYAFDCRALLLAGNNAAGVYDVKYYAGKFNAYQRTYVLQIKDEEFEYSVFKVQLEDKLKLLQKESKGTMTKYLTMGILRKLSFLVPPLPLQREFAAYVAKVEKMEAVAREMVATADMLYRAKLQEYFA